MGYLFLLTVGAFVFVGVYTSEAQYFYYSSWLATQLLCLLEDLIGNTSLFHMQILQASLIILALYVMSLHP
jgi:hypothetical protein